MHHNESVSYEDSFSVSLLSSRKLLPNAFFCCSCSVNINAESLEPASSWRSLIPVIKVNISTVSLQQKYKEKTTAKKKTQANYFTLLNQGRLAFGNHYLPQTLCVHFEDAFLTYATKPPSSHLDQYMHIVKGSLENVRVMLVPSPRYVGMQNDE